MAAPRRRPGDDRPVAEGVDLTVISVINQYRHEADQARKERVRLNKVNRDAYLGIQDFSKKTKGQSKEFLPKTPVAVEQFSAFVKRGLVQFGDWFSVEVGEDVAQLITPEQIRKLVLCYLDNLPAPLVLQPSTISTLKTYETPVLQLQDSITLSPLLNLPVRDEGWVHCARGDKSIIEVLRFNNIPAGGEVKG